MKPTAVYHGQNLIGVVNVDPSVQDVLELRHWLKRLRCPDLPPLRLAPTTAIDTIAVEECLFRYERIYTACIAAHVLSVDHPDALKFWWPEHVLWKKETP